MGEIPVLEEGGRQLTQTGPILLYLAEKFSLLTADEESRYEVLRWLFWDNQKMSGYMATYRFMRTFSEGADPAVLAYFRRRIDDFLGILEYRLRDQPFVVGVNVTIADISICAYLSYPEDEIGYNLGRSYPHVRAWLDRLAALPGGEHPTISSLANACSALTGTLVQFVQPALRCNRIRRGSQLEALSVCFWVTGARHRKSPIGQPDRNSDNVS